MSLDVKTPSTTVKSRSYDSPRRREQAAATRERILDAAAQLFVAHGFAGTSVPEIAREAQVALKTVYVAFETKTGLLQALWARRLAPGEEDVPVFERAWYLALVEEPDPRRRLHLLAAQSRAVKTRSGDLLEVIRNAATSDPEISSLWDQIEAKLLTVQSAVVTLLKDSRALPEGLDEESATDILWTLHHPSVWHLLVRRRRWSPERYEKWLAHEACLSLLDGPSPEGHWAIARSRSS
jgi:AcrR family transcriptional regulator